MTSRTFPPPEPPRKKTRIIPVFLTFHGCPMRCVFCAQTLQTGKGPQPLSLSLSEAALSLEQALAANQGSCELAFYGGTFTALRDEDQAACLALARAYREKGLITRVRASTRPDLTHPATLAALRADGLDMLELGVQSFADTALAAAQRGYTGSEAAAGCERVRQSGLALGIQLLPGMPGMGEEDFVRDVAQTLALAPAAVRLYPCLVLAGTELAAMYGRGEFAPWDMEDLLPLLATAQRAFWQEQIPVIRIGLAPQEGLDAGGILAGPCHPALGSRVRAHALLAYIREQAAELGGTATALTMPQRFQGEFWGHGGELKAAYAALGLTPASVTWHAAEWCELR